MAISKPYNRRNPPHRYRSTSRSRSRSPYREINRRERRVPNLYETRNRNSRREKISEDGPRNGHGDLHSENLMDYKILSYKDFIVTSEESLKPKEYTVAYDKYKIEYEKYNQERFLNEYKYAPFMEDKYHPLSYTRMEDQQKIRSVLCAKLFMETFESSNHFSGLDLTAIADSKKKKSSDIRIGQKGKPVAPYFIDHPATKSLVIENIPLNISKWQLADLMKDLQGYTGLLISDPRHDDDMRRSAWILFDTIEACKIVKDNQDNNFEVDDFVLKLEKASLPESCQSYIAPSAVNNASIMKHHLDIALRLIAKLDEEWDVWKADDDSIEEKTSNDWLNLIAEKTLEERMDCCVLYLRQVHNLCFYSGKRCVDEMHLWSTCGASHLRPHAAAAKVKISEEDQTWLDSLEKKLTFLLEEDCFKKTNEQIGMISVKWDAFCEEHTLKVEEERFRCDLCRKLFRGADFVSQHLKIKHAKAYDEVVDKVAANNIPINYMEDADRFTTYPKTEAPAVLKRYAHSLRRQPDHLRTRDPQFDSVDYGINPLESIPPPFLPPPPVRRPRFNDWDAPSDLALTINPAALKPLVTYEDL